MARMIPSHTPAPGAGRAAERALYEALRAGLSDDFFVYHGLHFLEREHAQEGEIDFLVAHRELGLLVIECKGEGVRRTSEDGWVRETADGVEIRMENPFRQAQRQVKALVEELGVRTMPVFGRRLGLVHGHAVAFPLGCLSAQSLPLEAQREIVLGAEDLVRIRAWVTEAFAFWANAAGSAPEQLTTADFTRFRRRVLHPKFGLVETLGSRIRVRGAEFDRLTSEQLLALKGCFSHTRACVTGAAGTGKTVLALEAARHFAETANGRVLLVCYNRALAAYLAGLVEDGAHPVGTVDILTFHSLCRRAFVALGRPYAPPSSEDAELAERFWNDEAPTTLLEAVHAAKLPKYEAIVVDEAQDFTEDWMSVLEDSLRDRESSPFITFLDPAQAVFARESLRRRPSMALSLNFRNTQEIGRIARELGEVDTVSHPRCPQGEPVVIHVDEGASKTRRQLEATIERLVANEGILPDQITILTPRTRKHSSLDGVTRLAGVELASSATDRAGRVLHTTITAFKGLESDVVLFVDADADGPRSSRTARYVAASRARHMLHVWAKGDWLAEGR